jgi:tetratricopeptide (TPR) repeat protein
MVMALVAATLVSALPAQAQTTDLRQKARPHVATAWEHMRKEAFDQAIKKFQEAIDIYPEFEDAYYGLGLANVRLRRYDAAIAAYLKCRDLYESQSGRQFANQQEAQRYRRERMMELDEAARLMQSGPQTMQTQSRLRQLDEQRRTLEEAIQRGNSFSVGGGVPSFVHLALGSAYFRIERWADAEREYKRATEIDPKAGEAFNNLAVVYLQTGRPKEADEAVKAAEKAGFKVHPQLKADIKAKVG